MKRKLLLLVVVPLILLLTSCSNKWNGEYKLVYTGENSQLTGKLDDVSNLCYYDGKFYYEQSTYDKSLLPELSIESSGEVSYSDMEAYYTSKVSAIYTADVNTAKTSTLDSYAHPQMPDGERGVIMTNIQAVNQDGIWITQATSTYDADGEPIADMSDMLLKRFDHSGKELNSVSLKMLTGDSELRNTGHAAVDGNSTYYMDIGSKVYAISKDLELLFVLDSNASINGIIALNNGQSAVLLYEEDQYILRTVDADKAQWGKSISLPLTMEALYLPQAKNVFGCEEGFLYLDQGALYLQTLDEAEKPQEILKLADCGVYGTLTDVFQLPSGGYAIVSYELSDSGALNRNVTIASEKKLRADNSRIVLTAVALLEYGETTQIVNQFNANNKEYYIDLIDYHVDDIDTAGARLMTEITAGKVPDIIFTSRPLILTLAEKGLIADLYPFLDNDPELSRDIFLPVVQSLHEYDGKLIRVNNSFAIDTICGKTDLIGDRLSWTFEEFKAIQEGLPANTVLFPHSDRNLFLEKLCIANMAQFYDKGNSICSFDSDEFIEMLTFVKDCPMYSGSDDYYSGFDLYQSGEILLYDADVRHFCAPQYDRTRFGSLISYPGVPTYTGSGNVASTNPGAASITTHCAYKEAAWECIRTLLTEQFQDPHIGQIGSIFQTNRNSMEKHIELLMDPDNVKNQRYPHSTTDGSYSIVPPPRVDIDSIMELINSATPYSADGTILSIILEEAAAFFAGDKSAADTARIIQSRVQIYVDEQK